MYKTLYLVRNGLEDLSSMFNFLISSSLGKEYFHFLICSIFTIKVFVEVNVSKFEQVEFFMNRENLAQFEAYQKLCSLKWNQLIFNFPKCCQSWWWNHKRCFAAKIQFAMFIPEIGPFSYLLHTQQFRSECLLLPALHDKLLTSSLIHDYWEMLCLNLYSHILNVSSPRS